MAFRLKAKKRGDVITCECGKKYISRKRFNEHVAAKHQLPIEDTAVVEQGPHDLYFEAEDLKGRPFSFIMAEGQPLPRAIRILSIKVDPAR